MITRQKREGTNGQGKKIWCVQVIHDQKGCIWIHTFDNEHEADNWIKYAY